MSNSVILNPDQPPGDAWHSTSERRIPLGVDGLIVRTIHGERILRWTSLGYNDSDPTDPHALVSPERGSTVLIQAWRLPE